MTRVLSGEELATRRTQLVAAQVQASRASAMVKRLRAELISGEGDDADPRQLSLELASTPDVNRWRFDRQPRAPRFVPRVVPPPSEDELGLSTLASTLLHEMREADEENQHAHLDDLLKSGLSKEMALDALAELEQCGAVVAPLRLGYLTNDKCNQSWTLAEGPLEWPDGHEVVSEFCADLPIDTEPFDPFPIGWGRGVPKVFVEAILDSLVELGAVERFEGKWRRVRRVPLVEHAILETVRFGIATHRNHLSRYIGIHDNLVRWSSSELRAAGVLLLEQRLQLAPNPVPVSAERCAALLLSELSYSRSLSNIVYSVDLPAWLVREGIAFAGGRLTTRVECGVTVYAPKSKPAPTKKSAKKKPAKPAKSASKPSAKTRAPSKTNKRSAEASL